MRVEGCERCEVVVLAICTLSSPAIAVGGGDMNPVVREEFLDLKLHLYNLLFGNGLVDI